MTALAPSPRPIALAGIASSIGSDTVSVALNREAEAYVARALEMIHRARALVLSDRATNLDLLSTRRAALGSHFQRYQKFKHGRIFDPVIQHGTASSRVVAQTMKLDCMELGEVFSAYHARWLGCRATEWRAYARDMLETTDMLKIKLSAELRAMRQLLMISDLYRR